MINIGIHYLFSLVVEWSLQILMIANIFKQYYVIHNFLILCRLLLLFKFYRNNYCLLLILKEINLPLHT
jgi:hypothetical protein